MRILYVALILTGIFPGSVFYASAQVTENYTMQVANFNTLHTERNFNPPNAGTFNQGGSEIGQFANNGSFGNTPGAAAFRTFTINGNDPDAEARPLQVGDRFQITVFTASHPFAGGRIGISFLNTTNYTDFFTSTNISTTVARLQLDDSGGWKVYRGMSQVFENASATPGADRVISIKVTSSNTFNATIAGVTYYNIPFGTGGPIRSFAIYTYGDSNPDSFWKDASLTSTGTVEFSFEGASRNNIRTITGNITDGLDANSNTNVSVNSIFVGDNGLGYTSLSGNNTFSGPLQLEASILFASSDQNLGAVPSSPQSDRLRIFRNAELRATDTFTIHQNRGISLRNAGSAGQPIRFRASDGHTLTIASVISQEAGSKRIDLEGSGTLALTAANTYTNETRILNDGTLLIGNNNALGTGTLTLSAAGSTLAALGTTDRTIPNDVQFFFDNQTIGMDAVNTGSLTIGGNVNIGTIGSTRILQVLGEHFFSNGIGGTLGLVKQGSGTLRIGGAYSAGTLFIDVGIVELTETATMTAGSIDIGASVSPLNEEDAELFISHSLDIGRNIFVKSGTGERFLRFETTSGVPIISGNIELEKNIRAVTNTESTRSALNGRIIGSGGLIIEGDGLVEIRGLSSVNPSTYSGGTFLTSGTLRVGPDANTPLGDSASLITITGGTIASSAGAGRTIPNPVLVQGDFGIGQSTGGTGALTFTGTVDLDDDDRAITILNSNVNIISGVISNGGLIKTGSGPLRLTANNDYSGITRVNEGNLQLGGAGGSDDTISGNIEVIGDGTLSYSNASDNQIAVSATVTISGNGHWDIGARNETISSINMSAGNITKAGNTLILTSPSSFTGGEFEFTTSTSQLDAQGDLTLGNISFNYSSASDNNNVIRLTANIAVNDGTEPEFVQSTTGNARLNLMNNPRTITVGTGSTLDMGWRMWSSPETSGSIAKNGPGILLLSVGSTYQGGTTINQGTVRFGLDGAINQVGTLSINGGTLDLQSFNSTHLNVTLSNNGFINGSGTLTAGSSGFNLQGGTINANLGTGTINMTQGLNNLNGTYNGTTANLNGGTLVTGSANRFIAANTDLIFDGGTLTLGGNETVRRADGTGTINLGSNTLDVGTNDSGSRIFTGVISGVGGGLTKNGTGSFALGGSTNNTYTGMTTINSGTLRMNKTAGAIAIPGNITLNNGTLNYQSTSNQQISSSSNITINNGEFNLGARDETVATITMNDGQISRGGGTLTLNGNSAFLGGTITLSAGGSSIVSNANLTLDNPSFNFTTGADINNALELNGSLLVTGSGLLSIAPGTANPAINLNNGVRTIDVATDKELDIGWRIRSLAPTQGGIMKTGAGSLILSGSNAYDGGTTIAGGKIEISASNNLGGTSANNTLTFIGGTLETTDTFELSSNRGMVLSAGGGTINTTGGLVTYNGTVSGTHPLTKTGPSRLILGGSNTYSGQTLISDGQLRILDNNASPLYTIQDSATLEIGGSGTISFNDASIQSGGTLRLLEDSADLTISGEVTLVSNATIDLEANSGLLDILNGASLDFPNGATVTTGAGTNITLRSGSLYRNRSTSTPTLLSERLIEGNEGWRMLASPVGTDYADMFTGFVTQGFTGATYDDQFNLLWFDETDGGTTLQSWRTPSNITNSIPGGRGHFFFIFDGAPFHPDHPADPGNYPDELPITMSGTGTEHALTAGAFDFGITRTERNTEVPGDPDMFLDIIEADRGWNLVGNPTASTIDWDISAGWTKTNIDNVIYIWDPAANSGNGDYLTWNGTTGTLPNGRIAPYQAFWVRANADSPTLIVNNEAKTLQQATFHNDGDAPELVVGLTLEADGMESHSFLMLSDRGSLGRDTYDAYRLAPMSDTWLTLSVSMHPGTAPMVINSLPGHFPNPVNMPIYIGGSINGAPLGGAFTLYWEIPEHWDDETAIVLMDHLEQKAIPMRDVNSHTFTHETDPAMVPASMYAPEGIEQAIPIKIPENARRTDDMSSLSVTGRNNGKTESRPVERAGLPGSIVFNPDGPAPVLFDGGLKPPRFSIVLQTGVEDDDITYMPLTAMLFQNYPNPFNPATTIAFSLPESANVLIEVYDILGRRVAVLANESFDAGMHEVRWDAGRNASGVYLYRMVTGTETITRKMTLIR